MIIIYLKRVVNLQSELIKFRSKEEKRTWQAEGLAKFSELLRTYNENMKDFGFYIISETVKYIEGNQGAIFLAGKGGGRRIFGNGLAAMLMKEKN